MFAKLLKHDCRAMLKYWWVAAVSTVVFAVIAGVCIDIMTVSYTAYDSIQSIATILFVFSGFALLIFPVFSAVLMFKRFNKNFFSDEGYLTFTLPVSKSALLASKLLTAVIFAILSIKVLEIDILLCLTIGGENFFDLVKEAFETIRLSYNRCIAPNIIYNFIILAAVAAGVAFLFLCITLANIVAKKRKLLVGIGVFYGVQIVITILIRIIATSGALDLIEYKIDETAVALAFLAVTVIFGAASYLLNLYLLDRHLNLE